MSDERLEAIKRRMGNLRIETFTQGEMKYLFDKIERLQAVVEAARELVAALDNVDFSTDDMMILEAGFTFVCPFCDGSNFDVVANRGTGNVRHELDCKIVRLENARAAYERAGEGE